MRTDYVWIWTGDHLHNLALVLSLIALFRTRLLRCSRPPPELLPVRLVTERDGAVLGVIASVSAKSHGKASKSSAWNIVLRLQIAGNTNRIAKGIGHSEEAGGVRLGEPFDINRSAS